MCKASCAIPPLIMLGKIQDIGINDIDISSEIPAAIDCRQYKNARRHLNIEWCCEMMANWS